MNIKEAISYGTERIEYFPAKMLLEKIFNCKDNYLIINNDKILTIDEEKNYKDMVSAVESGEPVQYITNHQEFYDLDFYVDENVLIPQQDTSFVVYKALTVLYNIKLDRPIKILDLCTGSGAIAIVVANELNKRHIAFNMYASDISEGALNVAKKNANNLLPETQINFIKSDLFDNLQEKYDLIISNPPYIKTDDIKRLNPDVQREPNIALDGGQDGLKFFRNISEHVDSHLNDRGFLILEIGYNQGKEVCQFFKNSNFYKDLNFNDRAVIYQKL